MAQVNRNRNSNKTLLLIQHESETELMAIRNLDPLTSSTASEKLDRRNDAYNRPLLSFVIPVKDEEDSLVELAHRISENVPMGYEYEIIFIDDGSVDNSWAIIAAMPEYFSNNIRGIRLRSNVGKAAGLTAGFRAARGEIIFTMDADLQDDPTEIPRFLAKLAEGFDVVSGYKKVRHDPWHKVFPSRVFNWMLSRVSSVNLHDHNCGFKCYRAEVVQQIDLFGELHRMVPSLAGMQGFRVTEIVVVHHPRKHGHSKYGVERFIRGFSDMLTIGFLKRYRERPAHFMNAVALIYGVVAAALAFSSTWIGIVTPQGTTLLLASLVLAAMAFAVFLCGLVSEQIVRISSRNERRFSIVDESGVENSDDDNHVDL